MERLHGWAGEDVPPGERGRSVGGAWRCLLAALLALALLAVLLRAAAFAAAPGPVLAPSPVHGALPAASSALAPGPVLGAPDKPAPALAPGPVHGAPALRRLTGDGHTTPWAWTPDGQGLLVQRPGQISGQQQLSELWLVRVDTAAARRLAENALDPGVHAGQLAYLAYQAPGEWLAVVADLDSGAVRQARPALWSAPPRWVGDQALYLAPSGRWAAVQGDEPALAPRSLPAARARLSPDGRYAASSDGRALVVSGREGTQVVARAGQVYGFAWSPDGARLAYVTAAGGAAAGPRPELWVWERAGGQARRLLRGELEHWGEPAWSPDGRTLALARTPTGSGTAGDLWLVEPDAPERARPLALTEADERAPCWSPDGRQLAFASGGDLYIADLSTPPQSPPHSSWGGGRDSPSPVSLTGEGWGGGWEGLGWGSVEPHGLTAPETIDVMHDARGNTCRNVPDGQIDAIPFEQYVRQVTPQEVPASWPAETLKTQAVAARTYGWVKRIFQGTQPYTVKDSTADQYMCDTTHPNTDSAVDATLGQYVAYEGRVIWSFYCAEGSTPTNFRQFRPDIPYLRPVHDPGGLGKARRGHSWGMSQWGAYRWASAHGWSYLQILAFYYTGATVEPATGQAWPLAAVLRPASGSFVTRDVVDLGALASSAWSAWPESGLLTVTFAARLAGVWTAVYSDTTPGDGWGGLWPVGALPDTVTPSIALWATAYDALGGRVESEPAYVGLDRSAPTGTLALAGTAPTTVYTLTLSLVVSATDPAPAHGPLRASLGAEQWVWEERALTATAGAFVSDTAAWDGGAWFAGEGQPGSLALAAGHRLPAGAYRAWVRLRAPAEALSNPHDLARLAVLNGAGELLGVRYPRGTEFRAAGAYQEFGVDLVTAAEQEVWWRVDAFGTSALWLDRISVASGPVPLPCSGTLPWSLPPREGPATVVARYVDGAENVSERVPLAVTVVDRDPPAGWRGLACLERACRVEVRDAIAGLDPGSGAGRVSLDGGLTWSGWVSATYSGEPGSHAWETLALPGLPPELDEVALPPDCAGRVQFRVRDAAAAANEGWSPAYTFDACHHTYLPLVVEP